MRSVLKLAVTVAVFALLFAFSANSASAQGRHPAYLHALTDLRDARAHLDRPDHGELRDQEKKAIHEINDAINEIKKAAIDDGKDLNYHPAGDAHLDWPGRLHRAIELLDKAHNDIAREEDNGFAQGLQQRALGHIDRAHHHAEEAIEILHASR
jgi:tetratricopeptide (TPR) repeat protein